MIRTINTASLTHCSRDARKAEARLHTPILRLPLSSHGWKWAETSLAFAFLLWCICFGTSSTYGASFDCNKAKTVVEKTICADSKLSRLDEALHRSYHLALSSTGEDVDVRRAQVEWLKQRDKVCGAVKARGKPDRLCLLAAYEYRIWKLTPGGNQHAPLNTGRYRVGWGWDQPICRQLVTLLNAHREWPPLSCGIRLDSSNPSLALPDWKAVEVSFNRDILKAIWDEAVGPRPVLGRNETDRIFEKRFSEKTLKLAKADFDVTNSGTVLSVFRAELDQCQPGDAMNFDTPLVPRLYAIDAHGKRPLDDSFISLTAPPRDVILFRGHAYLTWWSGEYAKGTATLAVYRNVSPRKVDFGATPVCTLSFRRQVDGQ